MPTQKTTAEYIPSWKQKLRTLSYLRRIWIGREKAFQEILAPVKEDSAKKIKQKGGLYLGCAPTTKTAKPTFLFRSLAFLINKFSHANSASLPDDIFKRLDDNPKGCPLVVNMVCNYEEEFLKKYLGLTSTSKKEWKTKGAFFNKLATLDGSVPSINDINKCINEINNSIDAGNSVYVHCLLGHGRSAVIVAAYLIKYENMSVNDAILKIKKQRPEIKLNSKDKMDALTTIYNQRIPGKISSSNQKITKDLPPGKKPLLVVKKRLPKNEPSCAFPYGRLSFWQNASNNLIRLIKKNAKRISF